MLWHCWSGGRKGIRPVKKTEQWGAGEVICLARGADLHMAQRIPLPLTVSCFSKIKIGFTFLVPAHLVVLDKGPLNRCVCVSVQWKWHRLQKHKQVDKRPPKIHVIISIHSLTKKELPATILWHVTVTLYRPRPSKVEPEHQDQKSFSWKNYCPDINITYNRQIYLQR